MFSEPPLSSVPELIPPEMSIHTSPISSASASPLSSASHSRTSTITSNSYQKTDILHNLQSNLTLNSSPQQHNRHMKIGKYYLEKTIGKGNFAVVKLATHCDTHQRVWNHISIESNSSFRLSCYRLPLKSLINHV